MYVYVPHNQSETIYIPISLTYDIYIQVCNMLNQSVTLVVNYSLSPPPRSPVRTACARTRVTFGPATPAPAPVDRPMDTG